MLWIDNVNKRYVKKKYDVIIYDVMSKMYLISESVGTRVEDKFNIGKTREFRSRDL